VCQCIESRILDVIFLAGRFRYRYSIVSRILFLCEFQHLPESEVVFAMFSFISISREVRKSIVGCLRSEYLAMNLISDSVTFVGL